MELQPNTKLQSTATYLIEKKIGQGGFGITYKGKMQHKLAFKTIEHTICIKEEKQMEPSNLNLPVCNVIYEN